ncbi:MAG: OmpH family outer membrane protein [Bdellovibrio sp.]|nr:OmpH family outer membrane protein [Bdellovibrio sp.]
MKLFLTLAAVMMTASLASADFKLAYVDVQKAIEKSSAGKKAKEDMKKEAEKKNKDLEKKKADVDKMREDIEKKRSVLSEEAFGKRAAELQEEMQKFNVLAQKAQQELQKREADLLQPIVEKMKKVIAGLAKEKGLSMVIQSNQNAQIVLFATPESDITEDVVKAFDKEK